MFEDFFDNVEYFIEDVGNIIDDVREKRREFTENIAMSIDSATGFKIDTYSAMVAKHGFDDKVRETVKEGISELNKFRTPLDIVDGIRVRASEFTESIAFDIDCKLMSISPDLAVIEDTLISKHKIDNTLMNALKGIGQTIAPLEIAEQLIHGIKDSYEDWSKYELADHLYVQRMGYTHHGIYVGYGDVVHYLNNGIVKSSLEEFADGAIIRIMPEFQSPLNYSAKRAIERANNRLGEDKYNVITNNCEHFVRYCRS